MKLSYLCFTLLIASTISCAHIKNIDNVDEKSPKGYIKFYTGFARGFEIYENDKWLWTINQVWSLKVAKPEGFYCFSTNTMGSKKFPICANIKDGLLTPVLINYVELVDLVQQKLFKVEVSIGEMRKPTPED